MTLHDTSIPALDGKAVAVPCGSICDTQLRRGYDGGMGPRVRGTIIRSSAPSGIAVLRTTEGTEIEVGCDFYDEERWLA